MVVVCGVENGVDGMTEEEFDAIQNDALVFERLAGVAEIMAKRSFRLIAEVRRFRKALEIIRNNEENQPFYMSGAYLVAKEALEK